MFSRPVEFNFHCILLNSILMNVSAPLMCKKNLCFFYWNTRQTWNILKKRGKERQTFVYLFTGVHCNGEKNWTWNIIITWSEHSIQIESTQLRLRFEKNYMRFSDFYNTHKNDLISIARFCSVFFSFFFCTRLKWQGKYLGVLVVFHALK